MLYDYLLKLKKLTDITLSLLDHVTNNSKHFPKNPVCCLSLPTASDN